MTTAWDWLKAKLEGEPAPETTAATSTSTATMSATESAEFKALKEKTDQVEAENRRIRAERIHDQAVVFADTQIRELRAYPAEREAIVTEYVQRATDDMLHGTVTFGEGDQKKTTSRVEQMAALFAARPPHGLTAEQMQEQGLAVLMNRSETDTADKPPTTDQVDKYLSLTPGGRATLAMRSRTNGKGN